MPKDVVFKRVPWPNNPDIAHRIECYRARVNRATVLVYRDSGRFEAPDWYVGTPESWAVSSRFWSYVLDAGNDSDRSHTGLACTTDLNKAEAYAVAVARFGTRAVRQPPGPELDAFRASCCARNVHDDGLRGRDACARCGQRTARCPGCDEPLGVDAEGRHYCCRGCDCKAHGHKAWKNGRCYRCKAEMSEGQAPREGESC